MRKHHLVKVGLMGTVGRFDAIDFRCYPRDTRVIVRTHRGLESGIVFCDLEDEHEWTTATDGELLRQTSVEDLMILERLERYRDKAFEACQRLIDQRGCKGILVDVEHTFDGESVFFYFMGEINPELESVMNELSEVYQRKVRFRKFSETLANGCGPNCGSEDQGCSSAGCGSCALVGGCKAK
jgi:cell fate regulator YaaT (PSP1 superfamily)